MQATTKDQLLSARTRILLLVISEEDLGEELRILGRAADAAAC
jgi:hypothetical protein